MPLYPLPFDDNKKMLIILFRVLDWLRDSKYRILIRWHRLQLAGIIEDINFPRYDEQYGRSLPNLYGWAPNGKSGFFNYDIKEFFEPRHRKLPGSGELKDCVEAFPMSELFVFTSRNTNIANDLSDSDFTYVADGNVTERLNAYEQHMSLLQSTNSVLRTDILKLRRHITDAEGRAATFNRELESAREEVARLRATNISLSEQNAELEKLNRVLKVENAYVESKMDKKAENAIQEGEIAGSTGLQQIARFADEVNALSKKIAAIDHWNRGHGNDEGVRRLNSAITNLQSQVINMEEKLSKISAKKSPTKVESGED